ncbi:MAG TPA: hypothetical protein PLX31_21750, partial [Gemmatimonadaceae bacterium]|nr:hypothetical protein [Gemmatimonadaceae bacterium]
ERYPATLYALCAYPDGRLKMVLRSTDGGRTWRQTEYNLKGVANQSDLRDVAVEQGHGWNNCIGVLPTGPGVVAIGWQAGTFVSPDAGKTWIYSGDSPHLHADVHVVHFRPTSANDQHLLLIGSDGGIAELSTDDLFVGKTTARSDFNRQLPTMQCYGTWPIPRQFYGTLAVSSRHPVVATGVQDNGNVYADLDAQAPWRRIDGGDGGWTGFVGDEGFARNIMGEAVTLARRQGSLLSGATVVPWTLPTPGDPAGVKGPVADVVRVPRYRNERDQLLVAVAGSGASVFGLFADDDHGTTGHWEALGMLASGLVVGAVGSFSGGTVHVGSTSGRFFALDTRQGSVLELPVKLPKAMALSKHDGGVPTRIVTLSDTDTFALLNSTSRKLNYVLRLDTLTWAPPRNAGLPSTLPFYGLDGALQEDRRVLLAVTDDHVYFTDDGGDNWTQESTGLPRRVHGADLRVSIVQGRGGWATMGTFGRSVYRAWLGGGVHFG